LNHPIKSFPFRIIVLMLAVVGCHPAAWAGGQVCESVQSGYWGDSNTWSNCGGGFPSSNSTAHINSNHVVSLMGTPPAIDELIVKSNGEFDTSYWHDFQSFLIANRIEFQSGSNFYTVMDHTCDTENRGYCETEQFKIFANEVELAGSLELRSTGDSPPLNVEIVLIEVQGNGPVIGHFDGIGEGCKVWADIGGYYFVVSYQGGDGNDVTLTFKDIDTVFVDDSATKGSINDGSCWANAYLNLQDALAGAQSGDDIWVASIIQTKGLDKLKTIPTATSESKMK
jgi:hypothetical protein